MIHLTSGLDKFAHNKWNTHCTIVEILDFCGIDTDIKGDTFN